MATLVLESVEKAGAWEAPNGKRVNQTLYTVGVTFLFVVGLNRELRRRGLFKGSREPDLLALANDLEGLLRRAVRAGGNKPFGICRNCLHFRPREEGGFCALLSVALEPDETHRICHEQEPA